MKDAGAVVSHIANTTKRKASDAKDSMVDAMDANGNREFDIEYIIIYGPKIPGIHMDRGNFQRKEFMKRYPQDVINDAVRYNPAHAKIPREDIDEIADEVIKYERSLVSGISTALGMPGGIARAATIPMDLGQYYGYMLRAAQKLMYLYGFPEIDTTEKNQTFDSETLNILIFYLGAMYGVAGTYAALRGIAGAFAKGIEKKLLRAVLTQGIIYPIVKSVAKWFGIHMTQSVFANFFKKAIPAVGGAIGGDFTFLSFKPRCDKLKSFLRDTLLSNPQTCGI